MALENYGALIAAGQALVPNLAEQLDRTRQLDLQEQQVGAQTVAAQARAAEAQREAQTQQEYQAAVLEYQRRPTVEGLTALMVRFPQMSEGLKRAFDAQDEGTRNAEFGQFAQMHNALQLRDAQGRATPRADLAASLMRRRVEAARAAGRQVDPVEEQALSYLESGNPAQVQAAGELIRRMFAASAGAERYQALFGVDEPDLVAAAPGAVLYNPRTNQALQSPIPQVISGPAGVQEIGLAPSIPVLGGGATPAPAAPAAPAPAALPAGTSNWRVGSAPGAPRDGGRRRHAGFDMFGVNPEWRPSQPFEIRNVRDGPRQGITADFIFPDGTRVVGMHLRERPQPGQYPAGALAGIAGNTGNARTTPPHIHAEAWRNGRRVDPSPYFGAPPYAAQRRASRAASNDIPRVSSRQQYARLRSGQEYLDPNGVRRVKQ